MPRARRPSNVIKFPKPRKPRYTFEVVNPEPILGKFLIEALVPVAALKPLMDLLHSFNDPAPKASA